MMKLSGNKFTHEQIIQASILDQVNFLAWAQTKDGAKGRNRPKSIVALLNEKEEEAKECIFASGEDFERARMKLLKEIDKNGY